jgi:hypothetical protein
MSRHEQFGGSPVLTPDRRQGDRVPSQGGGPEKPNEPQGAASRTEHTYTIPDLYQLPAVVPVAVADDILGIGSTLSKGLRAAGEYPVPLLRNRGRHHAVSLASLLAYLGLPLPPPTSTGEMFAQERKLRGQTNVDNGEGTAA